MNNKKTNKKPFFENKPLLAAVAIIILAVVFVGVFYLTVMIYTKVKNKAPSEKESHSLSDIPVSLPDVSNEALPDNVNAIGNGENTTAAVGQETTTVPGETTTASQQSGGSSAQLIAFPSDTGSWQMICLNTNRRVDADTENKINLKYVAGSGELMDARAAAAYDQMYAAAAKDGIYLTPCSGYRSYSTQKRLYNEFVNEYLYQGYSQAEAERLTSKRRMPPGSSEHNIGICMDIITASSSDGFQYTNSYKWLQNNAADYGFILRYPENKTEITGVKFEPWHWRYVGVENAHSIQNSGLCLEEYLGVS